MKHIIIYLAIALVMFGLLGWYFAQQEDLQPKALQAELSVSNGAPRWMWQPTTVWAVRRCR